MLVFLASLAQKVINVPLVFPDSLVLLDLKENLASLAYLALKVDLVTMAHPVYLAYLDLPLLLNLE